MNMADRLYAYRELFRYSLSSDDIHIIEDAPDIIGPWETVAFVSRFQSATVLSFRDNGVGDRLQVEVVKNNRYIPFSPTSFFVSFVPFVVPSARKRLQKNDSSKDAAGYRRQLILRNRGWVTPL